MSTALHIHAWTVARIPECFVGYRSVRSDFSGTLARRRHRCVAVSSALLVETHVRAKQRDTYTHKAATGRQGDRATEVIS